MKNQSFQEKLSHMSEEELNKFLIEYKFNSAKIAKDSGCSRQYVLTCLKKRMGNNGFSRRSKNYKKFTKNLDRFDHTINQLTEALCAKKPFWKIFEAIPGYLEMTAEVFCKKVKEKNGLDVGNEFALQHIKQQLSTYFANSKSRYYYKDSAKQKNYPDYWMLLTPLQFSVISSNNFDIEHWQAYQQGRPVLRENRKYDLSRLEHGKKGKTLCNCALSISSSNRADARFRFYDKSRVKAQNQWVKSNFEHLESDTPAYQLKIQELRKQLEPIIGKHEYQQHLQNPEYDFSEAYFLSMIANRPKPGSMNGSLHIRILDPEIGYTDGNVTFSHQRSGIENDEGRNDIMSKIEENISDLSEILSSDQELLRLEYCAGLLTWLRNAQYFHPEVVNTASSRRIVNHVKETVFCDKKLDHPNFKGFLSFKEGISDDINHNCFSWPFETIKQNTSRHFLQDNIQLKAFRLVYRNVPPKLSVDDVLMSKVVTFALRNDVSPVRIKSFLTAGNDLGLMNAVNRATR